MQKCYTMEEMHIDPSNITAENVPIVLGVILTRQEVMNNKLDDIQIILKDHEECLRIFRLSRCNIFPWIGRNKWIITLIFMAVSLWISSLDWLNRWIQWVYYPPRLGP